MLQYEIVERDANSMTTKWNAVVDGIVRGSITFNGSDYTVIVGEATSVVPTRPDALELIEVILGLRK